jgi:hypothetical protein
MNNATARIGAIATEADERRLRSVSWFVAGGPRYVATLQPRSDLMSGKLRRLSYQVVLQPILWSSNLPIIYRWMCYTLSQPFSSRCLPHVDMSAMMHQMNRLGVVRRVDGPDGLRRRSASSAAPPPEDSRRRRTTRVVVSNSSGDNARPYTAPTDTREDRVRNCKALTGLVRSVRPLAEYAVN